MRTVSELLAASLHEVFGDRDAVRRAAVIDEIYAADVEFTDPNGVSRGRPELAAKVSELVNNMPLEFRFVEAGPRYVGNDRGALAWDLGPQGAPVVHGVDLVTVQNGRITSLVTLLAP
jgi:SnoaL-like domain